MDKNKTIIAILSIAIVVFVGSAIAFWLFFPRNQMLAANPAATPQQTVQGIVANPNPGDGSTLVIPSPLPLDPADPNASPAPSPVGNVISQQVLIVDGSATEYRQGIEVHPSIAPVPTNTPASGLVVSGGTAASTPAPINKPRSTPAAVRVTAKPKLPAAAPAQAPARHGNEFWIQVISSPTKDRVEQIRKDLGNFGFNGRISAFNKTGTDFYRLRYGPYFAKAEAEKFLEWVQVIKGLEKSYLVEEKVSSTRK